MFKLLNYLFIILTLVAFLVAIFPLTTIGAAALGSMAVNVTSFGFCMLPAFLIAAAICNALTK